MLSAKALLFVFWYNQPAAKPSSPCAMKEKNMYWVYPENKSSSIPLKPPITKPYQGPNNKEPMKIPRSHRLIFPLVIGIGIKTSRPSTTLMAISNAPKTVFWRLFLFLCNVNQTFHDVFQRLNSLISDEFASRRSAHSGELTPFLLQQFELLQLI